MYICTSCGSTNIVSNKLDVASYDQVSDGTVRLRATGQPLAAFGVMALWGMTHIVNAFSHAHRCADSRHGPRGSDDDGAASLATVTIWGCALGHGHGCAPANPCPCPPPGTTPPTAQESVKMCPNKVTS